VGGADIFKGAPIAESALLGWEKVGVNSGQNLITDISQYSLRSLEFLFSRSALNRLPIAKIE
jgi:hypothetical protein